MKRIYQKERIASAIAKSRYREILERLPVKLFLTEYEKGEILPPSKEGDALLQIVVEGSLSIYYIRDDGTSYALAFYERDEILGQMEFFGGGGDESILVEVTEKLTCIAFPTREDREILMKDAEFLRILAESLTKILDRVTMQNAALPSLKERTYSYMLYKCEGKKLKGVEKAAFHLHCSPRQLQRILNSFVEKGVARKVGKGTYELC